MKRKMKRKLWPVSSLVLSAGLVLSPAAYAASDNSTESEISSEYEDQEDIELEEEETEEELEIDEIDEKEIEEDEEELEEADEDLEEEELDELEEELEKAEKIKGLQKALQNVKDTPAKDVISNLLQQDYDLEQLLSTFNDLADEEIDEDDLEDLNEEEKEIAEEELEKKKEEYKAYAEALREQFEVDKEALLEQLELLKEESVELYEEELENYQNMLEDLAELYKDSDDIESAFELQTEAVKANLKALESYKQLAVLYEETNNYQGIKAFVNGEHPNFDVPPMVKEGRTLIPFRAISEALQAEVNWVPEEQAVVVEKDGTEVKLIIGVKEAFINGEQVSLDVPAEIIDARTVVPLRFISEAFGANVQWDDETKTVVIVEE